MERKTKKILIISIIGLIALRIFSLLLIPYLPHLEQFRYNKYFSVIREGDENEFYHLAEMIYDFRFQWAQRTLGFPLMVVPFIFLFGKGYADHVFFPLIIFNSIILFSATLILLVWVSFLIFKKIIPAIFSGLFFVFFPFIFYIFRGYGPQFRAMPWNDINFFNINWLAAMNDQPAVFFAVLVLLLLLIAERKKFGMIFYSLLGFLAGFSAMVRITNVVFIAAIALAIFLFENEKKYRKLFFCNLLTFLVFLPQFFYNAAIFGSPLTFGYQKNYSNWGITPGPMWSFGNFFHLFSRAVHYSWLAIPAFLVLFVFILLGVLQISKSSKRSAFIVATWFFFSVLIYMFFYTGQTAMRYYMPAIPTFIILAVSAVMWILDRIKTGFITAKGIEGGTARQ